jgi:tetratricopeptide (TPR) repeat protein
MNLLKRVSLLCLPWLLVACGTTPVSAPVEKTIWPLPTPSITPVQPEPKVQTQVKTKVKSKVQPKPAPVDSTAEAPGAVVSLIERAQQQQRNGDNQAAVASLERAIRIAPRYPEGYVRLGELRYKEGRYSSARSLGRKALSLGASWWLGSQAQALVDLASQH